MKIDRLIAAFAFVLALAVSPALAQPKTAASAPVQAPAQTTVAVPESKIALILLGCVSRCQNRHRPIHYFDHQFES